MFMTKDIIGFEGIYFCDIEGNFFSYPKKTRKGIRKLKPVLSNNGYLMIDLCKDGKSKKFLTHRLIANCFIKNPKNKEQINHKNGLKLDNRVCNLEWNTRSENQIHAINSGLRTTKGEKNSQSKLSELNVIKIFNDNRRYSYISEEYEISVPTVSNIKNGYSWNHVTGLKKYRKKL